MTYKLGLTGSIGMGKSTTAQMFRDLGHPVWDADGAVHRLYAQGGAAVAPISELVPDALKNDAIDREALKLALKTDPSLIEKLESLVHPLVAQDRADFVKRNSDSDLIILDIPLLFEKSSDHSFDGVAVVSTDADTQKARVLSRPGMSEDHFRMILSRQMPDSEKRDRADWVIPTDDLETARAAVERICKEILANA
ncbi:dephospho-CoA kinase [Paracoccus onubensis]|uniref:Dephospho-CoA kinase n=1 Tax=Paracoccus onubensis TaxID=1675788 RepID=A0A418SR74_9RHOB|nr:dephospho-CoA kinase [Paracoccus onubensis]RJE83456.1 dephospho-CoA kinase [Paracoccus onubensis]